MSFLMLENTIIPKDYINTLSWVLSLPTKEALNLPPLQCHRKVCTSVGVSINRRLFKIAFFSILPKIKGGKLPPYPSGIRRPCHWVRGRVWGETLITVISATILQNLAFEAHLLCIHTIYITCMGVFHYSAWRKLWFLSWFTHRWQCLGYGWHP